MSEVEETGRVNQKRRTRKDLLQAATRLSQQGRRPSLEEIAEAAGVSRATAYRYFANVETLLHESALDLAAPEAETLFRADAAGDPVERVQRVDAAFHDMMLANEVSLRAFLAESLQRGQGRDDVPPRQNRRSPLIEAALRPARNELRPADYRLLVKALALLVGTESMIVCKDVLQLDDAETRKVKRWAIRALVDAARK